MSNPAPKLSAVHALARQHSTALSVGLVCGGGRTNLALLRPLLEAEGVRVLGQWESAGAALLAVLSQAEEARPAALLCPSTLPDMAPAEFAARLFRAGGPPVLMLGMFEGYDQPEELLAVPAAGYSFISNDIEDIVAAARAVASGQGYLDPQTALARKGEGWANQPITKGI